MNIHNETVNKNKVKYLSMNCSILNLISLKHLHFTVFVIPQRYQSSNDRLQKMISIMSMSLPPKHFISSIQICWTYLIQFIFFFLFIISNVKNVLAHQIYNQRERGQKMAVRRLRMFGYACIKFPNWIETMRHMPAE